MMALDEKPTLREEALGEKCAGRLVVWTSSSSLGVRFTGPEVLLERVAGLPDVMPESDAGCLLFAPEVPCEDTRLPSDRREVVDESVSPPLFVRRMREELYSSSGLHDSPWTPRPLSLLTISAIFARRF
jgi:hypothetical protein